MMDEITMSTETDDVVFTKAPLLHDKQIFLVRAFEYDYERSKKYMRSAAFLVKDELLTTTFADTVHCLEELNLFDGGNDQNKYLAIAEHKNIKNLKLKLESNAVFISKSEAKTICRLFNMSLLGYSMSKILEYEYRFTPESLTKALFQNDYLSLPKGEDDDEEDDA